MNLTPSNTGAQWTGMVLFGTSLISIIKKQNSAKNLNMSSNLSNHQGFFWCIISCNCILYNFHYILILFYNVLLFSLFFRDCIFFVTWYCGQSELMCVIIEPAQYFYSTAVRPWVTLHNLSDGQRHVTFIKITQEQVALEQSAGHTCSVCLDHFICTVPEKLSSSAPAYSLPAVILSIMVAL